MASTRWEAEFEESNKEIREAIAEHNLHVWPHIWPITGPDAEWNPPNETVKVAGGLRNQTIGE